MSRNSWRVRPFLRFNGPIVTQGTVKCPCDLAWQARQDMKKDNATGRNAPARHARRCPGAWPDHHMRGPSPASTEAS
ncbi:hypothetical protein AA0616_1077 [Komagataeibacter nataicola NRIC 0616]|nr:hypothetical protein AA0616_1077 [Komagataeibacter nataicola NRIC 0616]